MNTPSEHNYKRVLSSLQFELSQLFELKQRLYYLSCDLRDAETQHQINGVRAQIFHLTQRVEDTAEIVTELTNFLRTAFPEDGDYGILGGLDID